MQRRPPRAYSCLNVRDKRSGRGWSLPACASTGMWHTIACVRTRRAGAVAYGGRRACASATFACGAGAVLFLHEWSLLISCENRACRGNIAASPAATCSREQGMQVGARRGGGNIEGGEAQQSGRTARLDRCGRPDGGLCPDVRVLATFFFYLLEVFQH